MANIFRRSPIWQMPEGEFVELVAVSRTHKEIAQAFGYARSAGRYHGTIKERIAELDLSTAHFMNRREWAIETLSCDPDKVFVEDSPHSRAVARRHYLRRFKMICRECGQEPEWKGKPLAMVLDHINGVNNDHRLDNLRWLCPNCNSQMETFAGRNAKRNKTIGG